MATKKTHFIYSMAYVSMCIALLCVSAWITVPFPVSFTLQIFSVFFIASVSGWKQSLASITLYLLLGLLGVPVFSGFQAGPSVFFHGTGGYLIGFWLSTLIISMAVRWLGPSTLTLLVSMLCSLLTCYACGTGWYLLLYRGTDHSTTLLSALCVCVLPFIIPDLLKIVLAITLARKLGPYLQRIKP